MAKAQKDFGKPVFFYGVHCIQLNEKETNKIVTKENTILEESLSVKRKNNTYETRVFKLEDAKYLYEFAAGGYLLSTLADLELFLKNKELDWKKRNGKWYRFKGHPEFVMETDKYVNAFLKTYHLSLDFHQPNDLKKLDALINTGTVDLEKEYFAVVAIIGTYYIKNIDSAIWINVTIGDRISPSVKTQTEIIGLIDTVESKLQSKKPSNLITTQVKSVLLSNGK